jgi:hypothetical protein
MRAPLHEPVRWDSGQLQRQHNARSAFHRTPAWRAVRSFVLKRDGYLCQLRLHGCQVRAAIADHIVERGLGGSDGPENQRASCPTCYNKAPVEGRQLWGDRGSKDSRARPRTGGWGSSRWRGIGWGSRRPNGTGRAGGARTIRRSGNSPARPSRATPPRCWRLKAPRGVCDSPDLSHWTARCTIFSAVR